MGCLFVGMVWHCIQALIRRLRRTLIRAGWPACSCIARGGCSHTNKLQNLVGVSYKPIRKISKPEERIVDPGGGALRRTSLIGRNKCRGSVGKTMKSKRW